MKVLSIGNSFSVDATRYLYSLAKKNGLEMSNGNLYIGGCPLVKHYENMQDKNIREYVYYYNGQNTKIFVGLEDAIWCDKWEYVTFQQASFTSVDYSTYQPYLNELIAHVKEIHPNIKVVLHQTWMYKEGTELLVEKAKYKTPNEMFKDVKASYDKAVEEVKPDVYIRSGEVVQKCVDKGLNMYRDELHLSLGIGRFAVALTWLCTLYNLNAKKVKLCEFDEPVSKKDIKTVKKIVNEVLGK